MVLAIANGTIREFLPLLGFSAVLYAPLVAISVLAFDELSPWAVTLVLVPALAAHRIFLLYQEQRQLAQQLTQTNTLLSRRDSENAGDGGNSNGGALAPPMALDGIHGPASPAM